MTISGGGQPYNGAPTTGKTLHKSDVNRFHKNSKTLCYINFLTGPFHLRISFVCFYHFGFSLVEPESKVYLLCGTVRLVHLHVSRTVRSAFLYLQFRSTYRTALDRQKS